jgi:lipoate-protein ligase A
MALDHALADCLGRGEGVVRLYGWARPTVSFGRNEAAAGLYPASEVSVAGLACVRRPTGGRAVLHHRELTYSVVAPRDAWGGLKAAYAAINRVLAQALRVIGASVQVVGAAPQEESTPDVPVGVMEKPKAGPCFRSPVVGEVVARGRKLVGSAQARLGGALLQHGSILLEDDQVTLERLAGGAPIGPRPATLRELVGDVSIDELAETVAMSLRREFGGAWTSGGYRSAELETADRLEEARYARDSWTWRR